MNRRSFLKGLAVLTGIPAVLAGVVKTIVGTRLVKETEYAVWGKSPVQGAREAFGGGPKVLQAEFSNDRGFSSPKLQDDVVEIFAPNRFWLKKLPSYRYMRIVCKNENVNCEVLLGKPAPFNGRGLCDGVTMATNEDVIDFGPT